MRMTRGTGTLAVQSTQRVNLSSRAFAFWWLVIFGIHLVACAYNLAYAKLYWVFDTTMFSFVLQYNDSGMPPPEDFHTIAYVYMALATVHGVCALLMVTGSCRHGILAFSPRRSKVEASSTVSPQTSSVNAGDVNRSETSVPSSTARIVQVLPAIWYQLTSHHGLLGVKGIHFHGVLICREIVEVALQTGQAFRMSKYLPHLLLNRVDVSMLVLNCWSSVFVYSRWFWRNEARRRFAAIFLDCMLNLMTTIGVSLIIALGYVDEYDINSFDWQLIDDDAWVAQLLNEARIVLVASWPDLASRAFFSLGLVASTADMKELLRHNPRQRHQTVNRVNPNTSITGSYATVPLGKEEQRAVPSSTIKNNCCGEDDASYKDTGLKTRISCFIVQGAHYTFAAWGIVVLALHVHAATQTPLFECTPQVYPMGRALPSCYAVDFNCHKIGISATRDEMESEWERFDRSTTAKLRILHCPMLQVPNIFQDFKRLQELVVYNSTIVDWGESTAITNTRHPRMHKISIVRVNMTDGALPLGFQALDFPLTLFEIYFCETNLETLPDDLDLKWIAGSSVFFENSKLAQIPLSLVRVQPYYLVLAGNPITAIPPELLEGDIQTICLGNTLIHEFPQQVTLTTRPTLFFTETNISFFPSWVDPLVEGSEETGPSLYAGGSPYCSDLDRIMSGLSTYFSAAFQPGYSSLLMNPSEDNWELLSQAVDCSPPNGATQFPLEEFDAMYGLS